MGWLMPLSRVHEEEQCSALTTLTPAWIDQLQESYVGDEEAQAAIFELLNFLYNVSQYHYQDGILRFKGRLFVGTYGGGIRKAVC